MSSYRQSRPVQPASKPACPPAPRSCHGQCWRRARRGQTLVCPATIRGMHKHEAGLLKVQACSNSSKLHSSKDSRALLFHTYRMWETPRVIKGCVCLKVKRYSSEAWLWARLPSPADLDDSLKTEGTHTNWKSTPSAAFGVWTASTITIRYSPLKDTNQSVEERLFKT